MTTELERQTKEYYASLTNAEREEDRTWSKIASSFAELLWDE